VTLVDTNVLLDLFTRDPAWAYWSLARLEEAALAGPVLISDVSYAEASIRFDQIEDFDAALTEAVIEVVRAPRQALFLAGKAFRQYRRVGGTRTGVLPDFFIGAHAMAEGWPLLTRDPKRYRTYFPKLVVMAPT
jgi:predicted nucleic acid-binding protein